ncbi:AAA family ATPase [Bradyrhizobium sp. CCBAU 53421]|uniref:AAA family ATPase n=1 Tax=Bradyrhizobium sp. CCBAU 53421 TaxID=1325120 RepID=UPI00188C193A|nr:AAA-like domain-containing protein [Bradyrhizobium sp. CCBAU 53421]
MSIKQDVVESVLSGRPDLTPFLSNFAKSFDVTWGREIRLHGTDVVAFFLHPKRHVAEMFGFEREILLIFHPYSTLQARILHIATQILSEAPAEGRVEPLLFVLVSRTPGLEKAVRGLLADNSALRLIIPFEYAETQALTTDLLFRFQKYLFTRDLFDFAQPIKSDVYYFGRQSFTLSILDSIKRGDNVGIFGLRKAGKTSLLFKIKRLIEAEGAATLAYFDLEDQNLYQMRWWELLEHIAKQLLRNQIKETFTERNASQLFSDVLARCYRASPKRKVIVALDEIEHISPGDRLRMRAHWDSDFIELWKTLRAIQNQQRHVSFLICGVNGTVIETPTYQGHDNPVFSMAQKRYVPMFSADEIGNMIRTLGRFMGLQFEEKCFGYLKAMYGGHPLLTRQACSLVNRSIGETARRPYVVTEEYLKKTEAARHLQLNTYARYTLGVLADWYPEEFQMLQHLANGDIEAFREFEAAVPEYTEHLRNYELVVGQPPSLAMSFLTNFLKPRPAPPVPSETVVQITEQVAWDNRLLELSQLRITFEPSLRRFIKMNLMTYHGVDKWIVPVLSAVPEERRSKLQGVDKDEILQKHLFMPDLLNTLVKNWSSFSHLEKNVGNARLTKAQVEILVGYVNANRQDAHPKELSEQELATLRVVYGSLMAVLKAYEL